MACAGSGSTRPLCHVALAALLACACTEHFPAPNAEGGVDASSDAGQADADTADAASSADGSEAGAATADAETDACDGDAACD